MRTSNLPETESLQDDEKILCSPDDEHLYKIKKRFITGAGASKGGLQYWTETQDKIYNQLKGEQEETDDELTEHVNYISRTSIQITPDGTCFSAGEMDNEDNYTENFRVDAVNGDIYEKGQKLSEKYAQLSDLPEPLLPYSATPVKIGTWIDGRPVWRVVYYSHNTQYQSATSHLLCTLPLTEGCSSSDAVLTYVSLATNFMTSPYSPQWTPLPMEGNTYNRAKTSMGPSYSVRFISTAQGCQVVANIDIPDYGWDMDYWPYLDICIVAEFVV